MSHEGAARVWHVQPRVVIFPCRTHYRPSSVKCHDVDDKTVRKAILQGKRRLAAVAKQNGGPIQHIFCWLVDWYELLWRSGVACVQPTALHKWRTACKHCFMTCNAISVVSRLIWKRFRWKFIDIFEDVYSLHTCFSAYSFHILCCITPCESSGRFFGPPGIYNDWQSWLFTTSRLTVITLKLHYFD